MGQGFGHNTWLGFAKETVYGTAVAPTNWLELTDESISGKHSRIQKPSLRQITQSRSVKSKKSVEGSFNVQFPFVGAELLLKHAFGSVVSTARDGDAGVYDHVFTPSNALPVGLTLQVNRDAANIGGSSAFQYSGCQINKLTLSQKVEEFLMLQCDILGQDWLNIAANNPTFPVFHGADWEMVTTATLADPDGSSPVTLALKELELTIENSLAADRYKLGSRLRKGLGRKEARKVSGKYTVEFDSLAQYDYFRLLRFAQLQFKWISDVSVGALEATLELDITLPLVSMTGDDPNVKDSGPIEMSVAFDAYSDPDNIQGFGAIPNEITATLTNDTSAIP